MALSVWLTSAAVAQASSHWSNWQSAISSLRHGHGYRRGVVPNRRRWAASGSAGATVTNKTVSYGGGINGVGVADGAPKLYVVFWGSQWQSQGDPAGLAPYLENFLSGLGTGGDGPGNSGTWSGVMTQYCQGVSAGAYTCPSNADHVGYPSGGVLAGVWYDNSSAAPSAATAHQIGAEAVNAATHFGNTTSASNRETQYVIVSPTGSDPDSYQEQGFCAWHDYTADSTLDGGGAVSSPDGTLAFTNLPYLPDAGAGCGQNFVNGGSAGTLDGVSIVEGHEYAETITDQYPAGGWTVQNYSAYGGEEVGDLCAWIQPGTPGGAQNLSLSTGSFAVQTIWSNDGNTCSASHAIVTNSTSPNTVTVTNPGNQTTTAGNAASLQIKASDSGGATLTYSATGLPAGLSINSSSGLISGTPTTPGSSTVTVTATDSTGASGSTSFTWTVSSASGGGCTAKQLLGNPGFETGSAAPWTATAGVIQPSSSYEPAHSGNYLAWLDGYGYAHTDTLAQKVAIPSGCSNYTFSFWLHIDTFENQAAAYDTLKVQVLNSSGSVASTLATFSNLNANSGYAQHSYSLSGFAGKTVTLKFTGVETDRGGGTTDFAIDDTALNVS